jgi:hypothetical protein
VLLRIILILPPPLPIQLINDLLPARQHLQRATLVITISGLWYQEIRRDRTRYHESAHDLQHFPEIAKMNFVPCILIILIFRLECICEKDLDQPRPQFSGRGGDAMACAAVSSWEDFGWDLSCC